MGGEVRRRLQAGAAAGDRSHAEERLGALKTLLHVACTDGVIKSGTAKALGVARNRAAVILAATVLTGAVLAAATVLFKG